MSEVSTVAPVAGPDPRATSASASLRRMARWLRRNLFNSPGNSFLTVAALVFLALVLPAAWEWAVSQADLWGDSKGACIDQGACWVFVRVRLPVFIFGQYPPSQQWRVLLAFALLVGFAAPALRDGTPHRALWVVLLLTLFPLLAGLLLVGGVAGLPFVDTTLWGGLMLDVVISFVTMAGSLPLGVLLAYGRRSQLAGIRTVSIAFIELWRGVPLLTVLFMAAVLLPLFLPSGVTVDRLLRAMGALVLFNAAYMAEVVRGGLQGVDAEQEEAAQSLGIGWLQTQTLVVLPQAMRIIVPGIINTAVDFFKDTTLVTIVGLSDLLGAVNQALKDPAWLGLAPEGYVFAAVVFFVCCFAMSAYGRSFERRLARGQGR
ncbi:MAG: amino acid ABC transporter permease [Hyphomicrobiales bacterium]|nr:amino acid ABC transporter permease [Hyphomicrobiales bacterium]